MYSDDPSDPYNQCCCNPFVFVGIQFLALMALFARDPVFVSHEFFVEKGDQMCSSVDKEDSKIQIELSYTIIIGFMMSMLL